ncbi:MAG: DNA/RNA non-specific endonuclease, partial [Lachnospiraceae bacterium]|nr:DNA/RNA non-specific endonuclease [Lachnospiraceae bacterium]
MKKVKLVNLLLLMLMFLVACTPEQSQNENIVIENPVIETDSKAELSEIKTDTIVDIEEKGEDSDIVDVLNPETVARKKNDFEIPVYAGYPYAAINDDIPFFTREEMSAQSYEYYSNLDEMGRCGVCVASVGKDLMPVEERGEIGNVKPSGWKQAKYAGLVDGNYLYNRCHLLAFQLTGENANTQNLITGTRYLNVDGMIPFENKVFDYVKETGNHVMYRVTPVFEGDNLLASGVLMEAKSVEDDGKGVSFCVYCFNVQPGVDINYADGTNSLSKQYATQTIPKDENFTEEYAVNSRNGKIHIVGKCSATGN